MGKFWHLCFFSLLLFSQVSFTLNVADIPGLLKNLTLAIEHIDKTGENATELIEANLPLLMEYLASLSKLPDAIDKALPIVQQCSFYLGGCIIATSIIISLPKIIKLCRKKSAYDIDYYDEVSTSS